MLLVATLAFSIFLFSLLSCLFKLVCDVLRLIILLADFLDKLLHLDLLLNFDLLLRLDMADLPELLDLSVDYFGFGSLSFNL